jgi:hypothetical protein
MKALPDARCLNNFGTESYNDFDGILLSHSQNRIFSNARLGLHSDYTEGIVNAVSKLVGSMPFIVWAQQKNF